MSLEEFINSFNKTISLILQKIKHSLLRERIEFESNSQQIRAMMCRNLPFPARFSTERLDKEMKGQLEIVGTLPRKNKLYYFSDEKMQEILSNMKPQPYNDGLMTITFSHPSFTRGTIRNLDPREGGEFRSECEENTMEIRIIYPAIVKIIDEKEEFQEKHVENSKGFFSFIWRGLEKV